MACDCITEINGLLGPEHELETSLTISRDLSTMSLATYSSLIRKSTGNRENRRTQPRIFAHKFCPFCGVTIADEQTEGEVA